MIRKVTLVDDSVGLHNLHFFQHNWNGIASHVQHTVAEEHDYAEKNDAVGQQIRYDVYNQRQKGDQQSTLEDGADDQQWSQVKENCPYQAEVIGNGH